MSSKDVEDFTKGTPSKNKLKEVIDLLKNLSADKELPWIQDPNTDLRTGGDSNQISGNVPSEPMYLQEDDINTNVSSESPVSKTFVQKGKDFDSYVNQFDGIAFKTKEYESVTNYKVSTPVLIEGQPISGDVSDIAKSQNNKTIIGVKYESSNPNTGENNKTVILKQRDGNNFVFTAFQVSKGSDSLKEETPPQLPTKNRPEKQPTGNNEPSSNENPNMNSNNEDSLDSVIVSKSKPFLDPIEGGKILSDFLNTIEP
jgi:hypothetical protein